MELTLEQKAAVGRWIEEGARLADVQRRIHDEFGVQLTYMEVRLLVLDIGATPKDKPAPADTSRSEEIDPSGQAPAPADMSPPSSDEAADGLDAAEPPPLGGGSVTVELDKVVRAGAAMSGTVTFSDGVTGSWVLDAYGRLGITKVSKPGYQPSNADVSAFQLELQRKLSAY